MVNLTVILHYEDSQWRKYKSAKNGRQKPERNVNYLLRMSMKGFYCVRGCFENSYDILCLIS